MTADRLKSREVLRNALLFGTAFVLLLSAGVLAVFGDAFQARAVYVLFAANIALNAAIFADLLAHIRRDFPMLVFVSAFDLLLLGRVYIAFLLKDQGDLLFNLEADSYRNLFQALQIVTFSLLCCYAAYKLAAPLFFRREKAVRERKPLAVRNSRLVPLIRQVSVFLLAVSSLAFFFTLGSSIVNVLRYGYLRSFTEEAENSVPTVIRRLSMFFAPSFAIFLATIPSRRQMKLPMAIYAVYMLASLFTGRRNTFVCEALMILIYFVLRDTLLPAEKHFFQRKKVLWAVVGLLVLMIVLEQIAQLRTGALTLQDGLFSSLTNFIYSQGATFRVVIQTVNCWDRFDHQQTYLYLFFPFEQFAHNNVLLRTIFGFTPLQSIQNMQTALTTHNYGHVITFMVSPGHYLAGGGFGTSFVAESYVAYGMAGVGVVSALIGVIFRFFSSLLTRSWPVIALSLIAMKDFVYIPRNFTFLWVFDVFNVTYLCFFIGVYLAALLLATLGAHLRRPRACAETGGDGA